jgi:hypothetical protein
MDAPGLVLKTIGAHGQLSYAGNGILTTRGDGIVVRNCKHTQHGILGNYAFFKPPLQGLFMSQSMHFMLTFLG